MYKILIADDEIKIRETLRDYLSAKGFDVTLAKDGETAVYSAEGESFDLIILDVLMPKKDGLEACKEISEFTDIPILFLSALGQEEDLLKGYKFGADDYIVKPFGMAELIARVRARLRRVAPKADPDMLEFGGIALDKRAHAVRIDGENAPLTLKEYDLLCLLMENKGIAFSREQLLDKVVGEEVVVKVMFPTQYHAPDLAGKAAEFRCKIHEIRVKTQYELDDVFAQEVGGCYTFDEMREALKKSLQEFTDERGQQDLQERLLRQAAATLDYTPTFEEVEKAIDAQMENLEAQLAQQGLNTDMYCSFMNTTKEALREDARHDAEAEVRKDAAIREIVKLESLEVSQEEIGEAVALICRQNKITVDQLKPYYDETFEQAVMKSVLTGKVMRLIAAAADITVV